ncbi:unconventional prefoldin RPB5 interactor 1 [Thalassophryne amazonica]|uniref:unconventional prefoldin RPB5 interactor 1 n=1 Tax=Thalassophryne amazonica TaxID=390379 RepID=UPI001471C703|nr:unconventional prefoldin RPB5 interactor 1 [Thalassophryne amazonica]
MSEKVNINLQHLGGVVRLREEHQKVVKDCEGRVQHWKKVSGDYEALNNRLRTLPDQLSYDIMAQKIVDHRMKYVKQEIDDLSKTMKNFETRVEFTKDLETMSSSKGDYIDIREELECNDAVIVKGKQRIAHKPKSKPKQECVCDLKDEAEITGSTKGIMTEEELWARLDELEKLEELQDEQDRLLDNADVNGEDASPSSSEEEKEEHADSPINGLSQDPSWFSVPLSKETPSGDQKQGDDEHEASCLPTIFFSHTVEPKKVRINTGKNTTLKYSERKEQKEHSKRKKKNSHSNGHCHHELHKITTPADIYRLFVDVKNGEPVPRKSILKSRSRENSVCSDTSESSAADFEERRMIGRSFSHDETTHSDTSDGIAEEDSPTAIPLHPTSRFEAFSGTVIEKDPMPSGIPHLTITPPTLPTILERKQEEVAPDVAPPQQISKRVSKFKAARLQQK